MCGKFQVQPIGDEGYFPDGFADWLRRHPEVRAGNPAQPTGPGPDRAGSFWRCASG